MARRIKGRVPELTNDEIGELHRKNYKDRLYLDRDMASLYTGLAHMIER